MHNDTLYHYGVKGMKWGVRRYQNEDGTLTAKGRKRYGEDRYKDYGDGRIVIQKGAELQRVISSPVDNKQDLKGQTYASIGKHDNHIYMNTLSKAGTSKVLTLNAKTTLKSPTTDEAASIFFKTLKKNPKALAEYKEAVKEADYLPVNDPKFEKHMNEIIKGGSTKKKDGDLDLDLYYLNANYAFVFEDRMPTAKKLFYQELKNKGYNMLRDEYDFTTGYGAVKSPVILLDGDSSLNVKSAEIVNRSMMKKSSKYCAKFAKKGHEWANKQCGIS